jgi:diguanylate cyclase (GGDEF)-like protein/putative nucleotidyltransferase with HDIG domain
MKAKAAGGADSRRWQDIRTRAMDAKFDADRRRVGERVAVSFRWLFLIVLAVLNNVTTVNAEARVTVDILLGAWAVMNVVVNVMLARGYEPGKQFSLSTMALDIFFATGLVYLSDGFSSPFFLALFLAVITNAVRFGAAACVVSALVISFIYLFVGGSFTPANFTTDPNATIGKVFLFLVVALATGYMTRELERERRQAVERASQADTLRELSMTMVSDTDIKDVFKVVVEHAVQMTMADRGALILASQEGFDVGASAPDGETEATAPENLDEEKLAQVARTGEASLGADRRTLVIPIASGDGVTALLSLTRLTGNFSNQDLFSVAALSGSSAVPLANALRYHRSTQEATTDGLTGLANVREFRRGLAATFAQPDRRTAVISVLLVDFDHFKTVNDVVGHQHGDLVLQLGARIVRSVARNQDMVARYGGDEIVILASDTNPVGAQRLAHRLVEAVHAAAIATTPGNRLTFSIGAATYPDDALTAVELVAAADQALYLAKREGKDRACTFAQLVTELELDDSSLFAMLADAGPQMVVAVAHAVDHRSPLTQGHSSRVAVIADATARRSSLPVIKLEDVRTAAYLHDVGHMTLTAGQGFEVPGHAEAGEKILHRAKFSPDVTACVRSHHERWDGGGKPDGLAGDKIPLGGRIIAVAETFEALTAGRGFERQSATVALERVTEGAGSEFDPAVVEALGKALRDGSLDLVAPDLSLPATALPVVDLPAQAQPALL